MEYLELIEELVLGDQFNIVQEKKEKLLFFSNLS